MSLRSISIHRPRGLTLVELLMVISIMVILMAVAIPRIRPAFQDRNIREASRQVNAFFAGAKARAAETGRPVGVWIEPGQLSSPGVRYATRLYMAEVALPFTGAVFGSRITVSVAEDQRLPPDPKRDAYPEPLQRCPLGELHFWEERPAGVIPSIDDGMILQSLVGDPEVFWIKFNYQGPSHIGIRDGSQFLIALPFHPPLEQPKVPPGTEDPDPSIRPPATPHFGQRYQISRSPTRSIVAPLVMPADTVIDLSLSGVGNGANARIFAAGIATTPVVIMFLPTGQTGQVYANNNSSMPSGSIYLLIGRRSKVVDPTAPQFLRAETSNLMDATNLWVTISNGTGGVATTDNADTTSFEPLPPDDPVVARIRAAREFARTATQKGGR